jgi:hypothetical protein
MIRARYFQDADSDDAAHSFRRDGSNIPLTRVNPSRRICTAERENAAAFAALPDACAQSAGGAYEIKAKLR